MVNSSNYVKEEGGSIRKVLYILLFISVIGIIYSSAQLLGQWNGYRESAQTYEELRELYTKLPKEIEEKEELKSSRITRLNGEYIGWIHIDDTKVNYPIVKGADNEFYLTHNFHKKKDQAGAIFMDYRQSANQLDNHTIIYGHNMKDQSMFGTLRHYLDPEYLKSHSTISIDFLESTYEWEVFSVYTTTTTDWLKPRFEHQQDFAHFIEQMKSKSMIPTETSLTASDKLLTLSTCTNRTETERVIVHAKLKNPGGSRGNE